MFKQSIFHPILFALFPVLALYANNLNDVSLSDAFRPIVLSILLGMLVLFIFKILLKDWKRSGLVSSFLLFLFFSYGHLYEMISSMGVNKGRTIILCSLYFVMLGLWVWYVKFKLKNLDAFTSFLTWAGILSLIFPIITIGIFNARGLSAQGDDSLDQLMSVNVSGSEDIDLDNLPDIYYIILDGYARSDILQEVYDFDNNEFLHFLEQNGFFVAENSYTNYIQTILSLSSSLNMTYINDVSEKLGVDSNNRRYLGEKVRDNEAVRLLGEYGYEFVSIESAYGATSIRNADHYVSMERSENAGMWLISQLSWEISSFETMLIDTTMLRILDDLVIFEELFSPLLAQDFELHRKQILFAFDHLDDFASREGQHFIFVHFVAPHPPFVFDANGEDISPPWIYSLEETPYRKDKEMYLEQYTNELIYINSLVQQAVTNILAKSDVQPIIIIQGDHGPGAFLNWDSVEDSNLKERQAILNAYLLPEYMKDSLYDSISPVNSFRLILSQLFGFDIELLPDKIYFSSWDRPYEFFEITKMLLLD